MSTLADLKAAHPAIAQTEDYLNRGVPLSTIEQGIAALITKAHEDEARLNTLGLLGASLLNDINSLRAQLTASETAHAETRKALEEADWALIYLEDHDGDFEGTGAGESAHMIWSAALAREAARRSEKEVE